MLWGGVGTFTAVSGKNILFEACKLKALKDGIVLELMSIQEGLLI